MPSGLNFLPVKHSIKATSSKITRPPRFTDFVIEHWRVSRFIQHCVREVLGPDLLGSDINIAVMNAGEYHNVLKATMR